MEKPDFSMDVSRRPGASRRLAARFALLVAATLWLSACEFVGATLDSIGPPPTGGSAGEADRETISSVQSMLAEQGYDPGPQDGVAGEKTIAAVRRYQVWEGLLVDGRISPELAEHMQETTAHVAAGSPRHGGSGPDNTIVVGYSRTDAEPIYEVADAFVYSDGSIETVARVGGLKVAWRTGDGGSYTGYRNFLLPSSSWKTGSGGGTAEIDLNVAESWPSGAGKAIRFAVNAKTESTGAAPAATEQNWRCQREGRKRLTVAAGRFDTIVLSCDRSNPPAGSWRQRVWYYSPAIRHYVRRTDFLPAGETIETDLVAIRPGGHNWPPAARAGLDWAIQDALRTLAVGQATGWNSTAIGAQYDIKPTADIKRRDGA
ncbi:MAG: peptidoglycan-binding domain-containing protein, partial [Alphaproteobacteria bacterium]